MQTAAERVRQKDAPDWSIRGGMKHGASPRTGSCNLPYLRILQSHKYTKRMTDYEPRSTNPLSGSTSYIYKMR